MKKNKIKKTEKYGVINGLDISFETIGVDKEIQIGEYSNEDLTISEIDTLKSNQTKILEVKKPQVKKTDYKKIAKIFTFIFALFVIIILIILAFTKVI